MEKKKQTLKDDWCQMDVKTPTQASVEIMKSILLTCFNHKVLPRDVCPVMMEGVIRALVAVAQTLEIDAERYVHDFGKGLMQCELSFKDK